MSKKLIQTVFTLGLFLTLGSGFSYANPNCGATITGDTILDGNLDCSSYAGNALTIGANNVTLDLSGYTITSSGGNTIYASNQTGIIITSSRPGGFLNATMSDYAIYFGYIGGTDEFPSKIEKISTQGVYRSVGIFNSHHIIIGGGGDKGLKMFIKPSSCGPYGDILDITSSTDMTIDNNIFAVTGIGCTSFSRGIIMAGGSGIIISHNYMSGGKNDGAGIMIGGSDGNYMYNVLIDHNQIYNNNRGITANYVNDLTVTPDNIISQNGFALTLSNVNYFYGPTLNDPLSLDDNFGALRIINNVTNLPAVDGRFTFNRVGNAIQLNNVSNMRIGNDGPQKLVLTDGDIACDWNFAIHIINSQDNIVISGVSIDKAPVGSGCAYGFSRGITISSPLLGNTGIIISNNEINNAGNGGGGISIGNIFTTGMVQIHDNQISGNSIGVQIQNTTIPIWIEKNNINGNYSYGVNVVNATGVKIIENEIINGNMRGVSFVDVSGFTLFHNNIYSHGDYNFFGDTGYTFSGNFRGHTPLTGPCFYTGSFTPNDANRSDIIDTNCYYDENARNMTWKSYGLISLLIAYAPWLEDVLGNKFNAKNTLNALPILIGQTYDLILGFTNTLGRPTNNDRLDTDFHFQVPISDGIDPDDTGKIELKVKFFTLTGS